MGCDPATVARRAGAAPVAGAPASGRPLVGIFWCVLDPSGVRHLLAEHCALDAAEEYGDCLTFGPGHYEIWQRWRRTRAPMLPLASVIRGHEYEEWPRGRVVFDRIADHFFLYCDRRIRIGGIVPEVVSLFRLPPGRVTVRADPHYRSPLSVSNRADRTAPQ